MLCQVQHAASSRAIVMPASAGKVLFLEGDPCERVIELRRGIARGVSISADGERQVTAFFFPGDQIGLPIAEAYRFTAEAVTELGYVCHSRQSWSEALIRSCREQGGLLSSICAEQDPIFRRGIIIGRHGVLVRICAFLCSIIDRLPVTPEGDLVFPLPQIDIAGYLATAPESVCRGFRQLRESGIIAVPGRNRLTILNRPTIIRIASGVGQQRL